MAISYVLKVDDVLFDDFEKEIEDGQTITLWSQICDECLEKHSEFKDWYVIDYNAGSGICGVVGCQNEADHYIDFVDET